MSLLDLCTLRLDDRFNIGKFKLLVDNGSNVNEEYMGGYTVLMYTIQFGFYDAAIYLIKNGALMEMLGDYLSDNGNHLREKIINPYCMEVKLYLPNNEINVKYRKRKNIC